MRSHRLGGYPLRRRDAVPANSDKPCASMLDKLLGDGVGSCGMGLSNYPLGAEAITILEEREPA